VRFYQQLLGWTFTSLPAPMEYTMIATTDVSGAPGVGGGIAKRTAQGRGIVTFFGVASVDESLKQGERSTSSIESAGRCENVRRLD
jgi:predicted enzyme related to lactoylglutathione lyase